MKAYITKYALTQGIKEVEGTPLPHDPSVFTVGAGRFVDVGNFCNYFHKPYWHETKEAAIEHAHKMRLLNIDALQKQIAIIAAKDFSK